MNLIKQVLYHLNMAKARRSTIVRQTHEDIAKLLQLGQFQRALNLVEQLYRDQCRISAYEVINETCQCVSNNLPSISKNSELPMDVKVAISSLVFAASRCGELPGLNKLRSLFRDWYGDDFVSSNVNMLPMNQVKAELKETLSVGLMSENVKVELIKEIIRDYAVIVSLPQKGQQVYDMYEEGYASQEQDEVFGKENTLAKTPKLPAPVCDRHQADNTDNWKEEAEEVSSRESTDIIPEIEEREIVYLDDIKVKSPPEGHCNNQAAAQSLHSEGVCRRIPFCKDVHIYQPLARDSSNEKDDMHLHCEDSEGARRRIPLRKDVHIYHPLARDSSNEKDNMHLHCEESPMDDKSLKNQAPVSSYLLLGHVHPKLPKYEDLEAKVKDLSIRVRKYRKPT